MRKDMSKVIVERPRRGSRMNSDDPKGWKRKAFGKNPDLEDLPQKESMARGRKYGWKCKELNEHLSPLYRFLDKAVGRPWDKVYSEICENIKLSSTVQRHILEHVKWHVEQKTYLADDGKTVMVRNPYGDIPINDLHGNSRLYVHPVDGLLKKAKRKKKYRNGDWQNFYESPDSYGISGVLKDAGKVERRLSDDRLIQYHKIKGIWYIVGLKDMPGPLFEEVKTDMGVLKVPNADGRIVDQITKKTLYDATFIPYRSYYWYQYDLQKIYGARGLYAVSCKQMNSNELKKAGELKNDPPEID